jgi:HEAT repeat protein
LLRAAATSGNPYAKAAVASENAKPPESVMREVTALKNLPSALAASQFIFVIAALSDPSAEVRHAAAGKLHFWFADVIDKLDQTAANEARNHLMRALRTEDADVRRAAVFAAGLVRDAARPILKEVQQAAQKMTSTADADDAFRALVSIGPDAASRKILYDIAQKNNGKLAVQFAALPKEQWGDADATIVDLIAANLEQGSTSFDERGDISVLLNSGPRGIEHVVRLASVGPPRYWALIELGALGKPEYLGLFYNALSENDGSIRAGAVFGLQNFFHRLNDARSDVRQVMAQSKLEPKLLTDRLMRAVEGNGASDSIVVEVLASINTPVDTVIDFVLRRIDENEYFLPPRILYEDSRYAPALETALFKILDAERAPPAVFAALFGFHERARRETKRIIAAAGASTARSRNAALRSLLSVAPDDPAVIEYAHRCAFDSDIGLSRFAAGELYHRGHREIADRLYAIAVQEIESGETVGSFDVLSELAWPLNKLDPIVEAAAAGIYIEELISSVVVDETFQGETRTFHVIQHSPAFSDRNNWGLPRFAWPPPEYSERDRITELFGENAGLTLGKIDEQLRSALQMKGYGVGGLYRIEGGFLRAAKLEQLSSERQQAPSEYRFVDTPIPPRGLMDYLGQLFLARPGIFRLILFAVTSAPARADPMQQMTQAQARTEFLRGSPGRLPDDVQAMALGGREVYVLIYEFEKRTGKSRQVVPSPLPAREHLSRAGLLTLLSGVRR